MTTNLFSTYRQGENRVTATFLAVLQRLSLPNIDRILGALFGETSFSLVSFDNQPRMKETQDIDGLTPRLERGVRYGSRPRHLAGR